MRQLGLAGLMLAVLISCADSATPPSANSATRLAITAGDGLSAPNRTRLPSAITVQAQDAQGAAVAASGIFVTVSLSTGGGILLGVTTVVTDPAGIATFSELTPAGTVGAKTLTLSSPGLASATAKLTVTPGPPTMIAVNEGDGQSGRPGGNVPIPPSVIVGDVDGNPVSGVAVTFTVSKGGGQVTGAIRSTDGLGIARVGSWALGTPGENHLIASTSLPNLTSVLFRAHATTLISQEPVGLSGHLGVVLDGGQPVPGYEYGVSYYSSVFTLNSPQTEGTQLGWGSWLIPENRTFNQPLCPVGTVARDHWPERGPSYRDVYQTMEGGVGQWTTTQFPSRSPKFRVNSTPDCYNTQVASPGWEFYTNRLSNGKLGLAQLSNRLLLPPDGVALQESSAVSVLGYGWLALPLLPARVSAQGVPTGDQSWTLFLNASNYAGPVAFFTPDSWSAINATDRTGTGRGHDARPAHHPQVALEMGNTPMMTSTDGAGVRYRRIPRLTFPSDASGRSILLRDVRFYSKQAIWTGIEQWIQSGTAVSRFEPAGIHIPALGAPNVGVRLAGEPVSSTPEFGAAVIPAAAGSAFGLRWSGAMETGVFPEYYRDTGGTWTPVPASAVPSATGLVGQTFRPARRGMIQDLDTAPGSAWDPLRWSAGPFTASLGDGSVVDYVWYRFIDQPAITRLGLDTTTRTRLQTFVESLHQQAGAFGVSFAPPGSGTLATIDPTQVVTPPPGMERGFVPIVIRQR